MSEPVKKPNQTHKPESFRPSTPKIMGMMEELLDSEILENNNRHITQKTLDFQAPPLCGGNNTFELCFHAAAMYLDGRMTEGVRRCGQLKEDNCSWCRCTIQYSDGRLCAAHTAIRTIKRGFIMTLSTKWEKELNFYLDMRGTITMFLTTLRNSNQK